MRRLHAYQCVILGLVFMVGCQESLNGQPSRLAGAWTDARGYEVTRVRTSVGGRSSTEISKGDSSQYHYVIRSDGTIDLSRTMLSGIKGINRLKITGDRIELGTDSESMGYVVVQSSSYTRDSSELVLVEHELADKGITKVAFDFRMRLDGRVSLRVRLSDPTGTVVETSTLERFREQPETSRGVGSPEERAAVEVRHFQVASDTIRCVILSPDSRWVLCCASRSREFSLWEWRTGQKVREFRGSEDVIRCLQFSPDGRHVASGAEIDWPQRTNTHNESLNLWGVDTGQQVKSFATFDTITAVVFSLDGRTLATCNYPEPSLGGGNLRCWSRESREPINRPAAKCTSVYRSTLAFFPDASRLVCTVDAGKALLVVDAATAKEIRRFGEHSGKEFRSLCLANGGASVLSGNTDGNLYLWEVSTGRELRRIGVGGNMPGEVTDVGLSESSDRAICLADGTVVVLDTKTWQTIARFRGTPNSENGQSTVAMTSDGRWAITGDWDGNVRVWRLPE